MPRSVDILSIPLILPPAGNRAGQYCRLVCVERSQLNIFAGHNLLTNATLLVEAGLGYAICVGGSFEIRGEKICASFPLPRSAPPNTYWPGEKRVFHPTTKHVK